MMKIYLSYIIFNCAIPGFRCMIPAGFELIYYVINLFAVLSFEKFLANLIICFYRMY